jgi:hypothetical protein
MQSNIPSERSSAALFACPFGDYQECNFSSLVVHCPLVEYMGAKVTWAKAVGKATERGGLGRVCHSAGFFVFASETEKKKKR